MIKYISEYCVFIETFLMFIATFTCDLFFENKTELFSCKLITLSPSSGCDCGLVPKYWYVNGMI